MRLLEKLESLYNTRSMLATYAALARLAFQRYLAYRTANLAGLATNAFFGALRAYILIALFGAQTHVAGYSVQGAVTYTGLTQMLLAYLPLYGWWELMLTIQTGEIAADLSRPVDFFLYWLAQDVGRAACQLLMRGLPILALYALVYSLALPPTPWHAAAFVVSLVLALLVSFAWRFLVSLSAFWTPDARGVGRTAWTVAIVLSGFMMPVAFFPPWAEALMRLTPFPSLINTEVEIYLGIVGGPALVGALAEQLFWFLALAALSRLVLAAGVKKLVIQGG